MKRKIGNPFADDLQHLGRIENQDHAYEKALYIEAKKKVADRLGISYRDLTVLEMETVEANQAIDMMRNRLEDRDEARRQLQELKENLRELRKFLEESEE